MTLYFRRFKLRNPFKPSHKAYFETVLSAEAAEKKNAEKAARRVKMKRRESLVRLEGRERVWERAVRWTRGLRHRTLRLEAIDPSSEAEGEIGVDEDEDEAIADEEGEQSEEIWEGDWTSIFEYYE